MSFYIFTAPLFKQAVKPGVPVGYRGRPENEADYVKVPDMNINTTINSVLTEWSSKNPGFVPYGPLQISNEMIIQPFVKYESKLTDKFLELFLDELKSIPETGTAYQQARENFNEISKRQLGINSDNVPNQVSSSSSTGRGGGGRRNKTRRNKTRRNKTRRN